jgi:hypothetical protein
MTRVTETPRAELAAAREPADLWIAVEPDDPAGSS